MQVAKTFENVPVSIMLDSNGNGTAQFQPNGSHVNISRLYVAVSSSIQQASVTLYKGFVSASSAIGTIVSGSTGGLATGQIYVQDGSILYVVWTGGDANATATATFSGNQISFSEMGADSITWSDPIAASDGSLIFPAIKSPNFVMGVSGWEINRDGSFEFGPGGTIRGDVHVSGVNGSAVDITTDGDQAEIDLTPPDYTGPGIINLPATIQADSNGTNDQSFGSLDLRSPQPAHGALFSKQSLVSLQSGTIDGSISSFIILKADTIQLGTGSTENTSVKGTFSVNNRDQGKGLVVGIQAVADSSSVLASSEAIVLTLPSATFDAGRAYEIRHSGAATLATSITPAFVSFMMRKTNLLGTAFVNLGRTPLLTTLATGFNQNRRFIVTGSAVTAVLILTMTTPGGSAGVHAASAVFPREIEIYDIGVASDYSSSPTLV